MPVYRRIEAAEVGDVTVVNFVDRRILDAANIEEWGTELFGLIDLEGRRKLLLNFGRVEFLSSAALNKLIMLEKKMRSVKGRLTLCELRPEIREIFAITRLDKLFKIETEEQAALEAF